MNWYLAKMVFRIICGEGNHTAQFDEQLRLVSAGSKEEAFHKAQLMGVKEQEMFFNQNLQLVQWQFISVSELYQLNDLIDGAEVYSRIEEKENADAYLHIIHKKAEQIRFGNTLEMLNLA
jgi:predicted RNA-binding protein with EMAP domain